jgi:hypothetical protein
MANVWQPIDEASSEMEEATRQVWQIIQTLAQLAPVYFVPGAFQIKEMYCFLMQL